MQIVIVFAETILTIVGLLGSVVSLKQDLLFVFFTRYI